MFEITYPEEDGVLFLKYGDELVSAGNFGLVQWPESTQNLDVAFRVRISHCAGTKQWPAGSKGIKRDFHRKEEKKEKRKRTKYSSPERWMGASATAPASKQRLAGGAFGRNLGNYRLLGESPAKFIKGMWIEEGWGGRICCFEVSSSWGGGWVVEVGWRVEKQMESCMRGAYSALVRSAVSGWGFRFLGSAPRIAVIPVFSRWWAGLREEAAPLPSSAPAGVVWTSHIPHESSC